MYIRNDNFVDRISVVGTPFEIGQAIGRQGREAVVNYLIPSPMWTEVTDRRHIERVRQLSENTRNRFPEIWQELLGLAAGLELPLESVFAWNCRGDLIASAPEGCTTVQCPGPTNIIAHNEDGPPFFRGYCFLVDVKPSDGVGFLSFCYPGSLPGHTYGWNDAGLVEAVNNLRLTEVAAKIPRMALSRLVLECRTLEEALSVLTENPSCGGFHVSLAQSGDPRLLSVEYGGNKYAVSPAKRERIHANHALHLPHVKQIVTQSSRDRQSRGEELIRGRKPALSILRDEGGPGLPIFRNEPNDPDDENTLSTCIMSVSPTRVDWKIYAGTDSNPSYQS